MKAIIFDLDGTLIDSAPDIHKAANALLAKMGRDPLALELVASFIGNGVGKLVERVLDASGGFEGDPAPLIDRFKTIYGESPAELTIIFEGVANALQALARDYRLGICTNKPEAISRQLLDELGLSAHFGALIGGDSTSHMKPHPAPLLACMKALDAGPDDCLFIGDSGTDEATARAAALDFGFYQGGYCHGDPGKIEAAFAFSDYKDLATKISAHWDARQVSPKINMNAP